MKLYKLDSKGKVREWEIEVIDQGTFAEVLVTTGQVDGKKVAQSYAVREGKNVGKANATTYLSQAEFEAEAKITQQLRKGYVKNVADVKAHGTLGSGILSPMLAKIHHPTGAQKDSKTLAQMGIEGEDIVIQPKIDGNRCLVVANDEGVVMYTRKGDAMPVQLKKLVDSVRTVYDTLFKGREVVLDGELYSDDMTFNELNGHLKRKSSQDQEALDKIYYVLYDVMTVDQYPIRYELIKLFESDIVRIIPNRLVVATDENINAHLEEWLSEGYEGAMIRTLDKGYENKRTWQLVKVKIFEDSEFRILDLEEDSMGRLGKFIMEMDVPTLDKDGSLAETFKAGVKGITHAEGKKMLANKEKYIGKMATITYFGRDIRPRFPKFKAIRED